jgi:hypothetical protein
MADAAPLNAERGIFSAESENGVWCCVGVASGSWSMGCAIENAVYEYVYDG